MTRSDDYTGDMADLFPHQRSTLDDRAVEMLLRARPRASSPDLADLAALLTDLRTVVDDPAPTPTPALAAMLTAGLPATAPASPGSASGRSTWRRARRTAMIAAMSSLISVPVMGVAAAADRLPDAAQHVVARVIEVTTPFTVADPQTARRGNDANSPAKRTKSTRPDKRKRGDRPAAPAGVLPSDAPTPTPSVAEGQPSASPDASSFATPPVEMPQPTSGPLADLTPAPQPTPSRSDSATTQPRNDETASPQPSPSALATSTTAAQRTDVGGTSDAATTGDGSSPSDETSLADAATGTSGEQRANDEGTSPSDGRAATRAELARSRQRV